MSLPRLKWRGVGRALRVVALEDPELDTRRLVTRGLAEMLADGARYSATDEPPTWPVVRAQRFDPLRSIAAAEIGAWIGEDAGAGAESGLAAWREITPLLRTTDDDGEASLGALVLPPLEPPSLSAVLSLAARASGVLFLLEVRDPALGSASGATRVELRLPLENAVVARVCGPERVDLVGFLRALEAADVRADGSPAAVGGAEVEAREIALALLTSARRERGFEPGVIESIEEIVASVIAWRRWQGLSRSIDLGTRGLLYEHAPPGLERRVERVVEEFLGRMARRGIVESSRDTRSVRCELETEDDDGLRASIVVRARLGEGHHAALERARSAPRTPVLAPARPLSARDAIGTHGASGRESALRDRGS